MFWVPKTFRDWMWLVRKVLTDTESKRVALPTGNVRITCPHCGRTY